MEYFDSECLCLKAIDYKENDKLITLYCAGKGKIVATAKGCKSPKAKLKYATSPLCFGHYYFSKKNGRYTLTGCDCLDSFFDLSTDIEKFYTAMTIVEVLDKTQLEGQYDNVLFVHSLRTLNCLKDSQNEDIKKIVFDFLVKTVHILGYECFAIKLTDFSSYFFNNLGIKLNSLDFLLKL